MGEGGDIALDHRETADENQTGRGMRKLSLSQASMYLGTIHVCAFELLVRGLDSMSLLFLSNGKSHRICRLDAQRASSRSPRSIASNSAFS